MTAYWQWDHLGRARDLFVKVDLGIVRSLLAGLLIVVSLIQPLANRLRLSSAVLLAIVGVAIGVTSTLFNAFARVIVELPIHSDGIHIYLPAVTAVSDGADD